MGALFKKPAIQAAVRMPDPEDQDARMAAQRQMQTIAARNDRQSTMLSRRAGGSGGAGTMAYGNSLLGQG